VIVPDDQQSRTQSSTSGTSFKGRSDQSFKSKSSSGNEAKSRLLVANTIAQAVTTLQASSSEVQHLEVEEIVSESCNSWNGSESKTSDKQTDNSGSGASSFAEAMAAKHHEYILANIRKTSDQIEVESMLERIQDQTATSNHSVNQSSQGPAPTPLPNPTPTAVHSPAHRDSLRHDSETNLSSENSWFAFSHHSIASKSSEETICPEVVPITANKDFAPTPGFFPDVPTPLPSDSDSDSNSWFKSESTTSLPSPPATPTYRTPSLDRATTPLPAPLHTPTHRASLRHNSDTNLSSENSWFAFSHHSINQSSQEIVEQAGSDNESEISYHSNSSHMSDTSNTTTNASTSQLKAVSGMLSPTHSILSVDSDRKKDPNRHIRFAETKVTPQSDEKDTPRESQGDTKSGV